MIVGWKGRESMACDKESEESGFRIKICLDLHAEVSELPMVYKVFPRSCLAGERSNGQCMLRANRIRRC